MTGAGPAFGRLLLALALAVGGGGGALAASCPGARGAPPVSFEGRFAEPRYDHGHSRDEIRAIARQRGMAGRVFAGLTHGSYQSKVSASVEVTPQRRGGGCVRLTKVRGRLDYTDLTVYMAREYRRGSCAYRVILEHENEHVAINRRAFDRHLPKLRRKLETAARNLKPFWVARSEDGAQAAVDRLQKALQPALRELEREMERQNTQIDTEESYRRLGARCTDW